MERRYPKDIFDQIRNDISGTYESGEADTIALEVLSEIFNLSRTDLIVNSPLDVDVTSSAELNSIIERLQSHEPVQYIFNKAHFYGREFYVDENVLIPRQETESLIQLITNWQNWDSPKILDIGTGSGCIACSLALEIDYSKVAGIDVSSSALIVAERNSKQLQANVTFSKTDILNEPIQQTELDIIVSNPPYVREIEKKEMKANVIDNEPNLALFVPDNDPLLFYDAIVKKSKTALKKGGLLFFEINEAFGEEMNNLFSIHGFANPQIHQDLHGKDRFASAEWRD